MIEDEEVGDASQFAHLPSGQRLYHLVLAMSDEQIRNGQVPTLDMPCPALAEVWSDVDELSLLMLEEDPEDSAATDYRQKWNELNVAWRDPGRRNWKMTAAEGRARSRVIKRFLLRAGPLSLRRRKGDSSRDYWTQEALEFQ